VNVEENKDEQDKKKKWIGRTIIFVLIVTGILIIIFEGKKVKQILQDFLLWIKDNPVLGPFLLALVYIFAVVFFMPGSILTLGSGFALNQAY